MDELRSEIRAAFEKEQAAHPPAAALRRDMVNAVAAHTRSAPNLQWLAVAAAILLGLAVVAGLMSSRLAHRTTVPGHTKPTAADYGPPPAGVPLLYVQDPNNSSWLIGYDWSGKPRGTVKLSGSASSMVMAPDGSSFALRPYDPPPQNTGGSTAYFDRLGHPIALGPMAVADPAQVNQEIWADDNKHVCFDFAKGLSSSTLFTRLPGQPDHQVNYLPPQQLGRQSSQGRQTSLEMLLQACSYRYDYAVVELIAFAGYSPIDVRLVTVKLSTGKVLNNRDLGINALLAASRDGVYLAQSSGYRQSQVSTILKTSDLAFKVQLDPGLVVLAFSGDDSLALVSSQPTGGPWQLEVLDWRSGKVIWRYDLRSESPGSYTAAPSGSDFAIALWTPPADPNPCGPGKTAPCQVLPPDLLRDVIIVHADGTTTRIPGRYATTW